MKVIKTKQNGVYEITEDQFRVCSAMATMINNIDNASDDITQQQNYLHHLFGLKWAAALIDTPDMVIFDITINKNIKGYQNMNKLSEVTYF